MAGAQVAESSTGLQKRDAELLCFLLRPRVSLLWGKTGCPESTGPAAALAQGREAALPRKRCAVKSPQGRHKETLLVREVQALPHPQGQPSKYHGLDVKEVLGTLVSSKGDTTLCPPLGDSALRPPLGDSALRPPLGDSALRPPLGDSALRPPQGDSALRPPLGDTALRPPQGDGALRPLLGDTALRPPDAPAAGRRRFTPTGYARGKETLLYTHRIRPPQGDSALRPPQGDTALHPAEWKKSPPGSSVLKNRRVLCLHHHYLKQSSTRCCVFLHLHWELRRRKLLPPAAGSDAVRCLPTADIFPPTWMLPEQSERQTSLNDRGAEMAPPPPVRRSKTTPAV
ncbi:uncharacterized protein LOC103886581 [Papio anubis]|uniref:uncharacterized protein LOC103886581 n=1 Tax=Papio anubis TaxID=9555 RepID=UPI0012ADB8E1|nr:uncharacterized protein LOC103886581 [Papio anubis]